MNWRKAKMTICNNDSDKIEYVFTITHINCFKIDIMLLKDLHQLFDLSIAEIKNKLENLPFSISLITTENVVSCIGNKLKEMNIDFDISVKNFKIYKLILREYQARDLISAIKRIKELLNITLSEARAVFSKLPYELMTASSAIECEKVANELSAVGCVMDLIEQSFPSMEEKTVFYYESKAKKDIYYSEPLKSGGELIVRSNSWFIKHYFPGPDLRFNGHTKIINSSDIDAYINAWKNNFIKCSEISKQVTNGGELIIRGEKGLQIICGRNFNGVSIEYPHKPFASTQQMIDDIISDYIYAKERAKEIQTTFT